MGKGRRPATRPPRRPRFVATAAAIPTARPGARPGPELRQAWVVEDRQTGRWVGEAFPDAERARQLANRLNADIP